MVDGVLLHHDRHMDEDTDADMGVGKDAGIGDNMDDSTVENMEGKMGKNHVADEGYNTAGAPAYKVDLDFHLLVKDSRKHKCNLDTGHLQSFQLNCCLYNPQRNLQIILCYYIMN